MLTRRTALTKIFVAAAPAVIRLPNLLMPVRPLHNRITRYALAGGYYFVPDWRDSWVSATDADMSGIRMMHARLRGFEEADRG